MNSFQPSAASDGEVPDADHRSRVAAHRRERMRMRLIESALQVFAEKGIEAADIKDVIERAQVSRGSFYNHFQTNEDVMAAVLMALGNELLALVDVVVTTRSDPVERVACGLRMVLRTAAQYPLLARFAARVGLSTMASHSLAMQYLPRDIQMGLDQRRFLTQQPAAALTMALGAAHAGLCAVAINGELPKRFPEDMAFQVLLGLGVPADAARTAADLPIASVSLPDASLLVRTHRAPLHP